MVTGVFPPSRVSSRRRSHLSKPGVARWQSVVSLLGADVFCLTHMGGEYKRGSSSVETHIPFHPTPAHSCIHIIYLAPVDI